MGAPFFHKGLGARNMGEEGVTVRFRNTMDGGAVGDVSWR